MLPSKGYFAHLKCHLNETESCDRPYCHYKHVKHKHVSENIIEECVQKSIQCLESKIGPIKNVTQIKNNVTAELNNAAKMNELNKTNTYNPTPIDKLNGYRHIPIQFPPYRPPIRPLDSSLQSKLSHTNNFSYIHQNVEQNQGTSSSDDDSNVSNSLVINGMQYVPSKLVENCDASTEINHSFTDDNTSEMKSSVSEIGLVSNEDFDFITEVLNEIHNNETEDDSACMETIENIQLMIQETSKTNTTPSRNESKSFIIAEKRKVTKSEKRKTRSITDDGLKAKKHNSRKQNPNELFEISKSENYKSNKKDKCNDKKKESKQNSKSVRKSKRHKDVNDRKNSDKTHTKSNFDEKRPQHAINDLKLSKKVKSHYEKHEKLSNLTIVESSTKIAERDLFLSSNEDSDSTADTNSNEYLPPVKRRLAHNPDQTKPCVSIKSNFHAESSKILIERYKIRQETYLKSLSKTVSTSMNKDQLETIKSNTIIRPVSKELLKTTFPPERSSVIPFTIPHTTEKGKKRIMHKSKSMDIDDRPLVINADNSKLPVHTRSIQLNRLIDACLEMYPSKNAAYERAQSEEYKVFQKCKSLTVYKSSCKLTLYRLKNEQLLPSIKPSAEIKQNLYFKLKPYLLTDEQLWENGYPKFDQSGSVIIKQNPNVQKTNLSDSEKICARCQKIYKVTRKGFPLNEDTCIYHYKKRYRKNGETRYGCCNSNDEVGCVTAPFHVYESTDYSHLTGYISTANSKAEMVNDVDNNSEDYGVFALDCEMSYTTAGIELTRVSIIDKNCDVVYETLVKPFHKIIDYNTRFSGIDEKQMRNVKTTLVDVQSKLLKLFNNRTILIGHSLDSDFKALKLVHNTVIDTSVMFPHRFGAPYKRALKTLAYEYLSKIIQNDVTTGHDSAEDALACMQLVLWKVKNSQ